MLSSLTKYITYICKEYNSFQDSKLKFYFFLSATWPSHGKCWATVKGEASNMMLITLFASYSTWSHQELHIKVGPLSLAEQVVWFELGSFQFWMKCLDPICHSFLIISDFKTYQIMLFRQLNFGALSINRYFTFIKKEKLQFFLICSFYCCLVKDDWALKVDLQFAVSELPSHKN